MPAVRHPPRHTALAALPAIALDLETTGLDVANDRIVQIGAVGMRGPTVLGEPRIDTLVDPGIPIPAASARIHRITDSDAAGSPRLPELLESLVEMFAGRVVVGQNVRFDLAVLRHEAARAGVPWRDPPVLDVSHLAGALDRSLVDLSLDSLANRFGITIEARHDALGDSLAAAGIFSALVPRLREADVRTLGEAEAFAARRADLDRREAEAGWHSMPGDAPVARPLPSRIDSFLYLRRLDEVMSAPRALGPPRGRRCGRPPGSWRRRGSVHFSSPKGACRGPRRIRPPIREGSRRRRPRAFRDRRWPASPPKGTCCAPRRIRASISMPPRYRR